MSGLSNQTVPAVMAAARHPQAQADPVDTRRNRPGARHEDSRSPESRRCWCGPDQSSRRSSPPSGSRSRWSPNTSAPNSMGWRSLRWSSDHLVQTEKLITLPGVTWVEDGEQVLVGAVGDAFRRPQRPVAQGVVLAPAEPLGIQFSMGLAISWSKALLRM